MKSFNYVMKQLDEQLNSMFGEKVDWKKKSIIHERVFVRGNDITIDDEAKDTYSVDEFLKAITGQGVRTFLNQQGEEVRLDTPNGLASVAKALMRLFPNGIRADVIKDYQFELTSRTGPLTAKAISDLKNLNDKPPAPAAPPAPKMKTPPAPGVNRFDLGTRGATATSATQSTLTPTGIGR